MMCHKKIRVIYVTGAPLNISNKKKHIYNLKNKKQERYVKEEYPN